MQINMLPRAKTKHDADFRRSYKLTYKRPVILTVDWHGAFYDIGERNIYKFPNVYGDFKN